MSRVGDLVASRLARETEAREVWLGAWLNGVEAYGRAARVEYGGAEDAEVDRVVAEVAAEHDQWVRLVNARASDVEQTRARARGWVAGYDAASEMFSHAVGSGSWLTAVE